jgi:hypothetical protein
MKLSQEMWTAYNPLLKDTEPIVLQQVIQVFFSEEAMHGVDWLHVGHPTLGHSPQQHGEKHVDFLSQSNSLH